MGFFNTPSKPRMTAEDKAQMQANEELGRFVQHINEADSNVVILRRDFCDDELVFPPLAVITGNQTTKKNTSFAMAMIDGMKILLSEGYKMVETNILPGKKEYLFIRQ